SYDPAVHGLPPAAHPRPDDTGPSGAVPEAPEPRDADVEPLPLGEDDPPVSTEPAQPTDEQPDGPGSEGDTAPVATTPQEPQESEAAPVVEEPNTPQPTAPRDEPAATRPAARRGRPQVPSWDDIMFGSRRE
ncbi:MAG: septation protein SepH, partial [Actinomycetota bacterium]|nr:septation protein SepH [Actinomycetota bacterium]